MNSTEKANLGILNKMKPSNKAVSFFEQPKEKEKMDESPTVVIPLPTRLTQFDKSNSTPSGGTGTEKEKSFSNIQVELIDSATPSRTGGEFREDGNQRSHLVFGKKRAVNKNRPPMRKFDGNQCLDDIESDGSMEQESSRSSKIQSRHSKAQLNEPVDDAKSMYSKASSVAHIGLGGLGGGFGQGGFGGDSEEDSDEFSESENSIYTETDLAESTYAMSVRTYEKAYLAKNSSLISRKGKGDASGKSANSQMSHLTMKSKKSTVRHKNWQKN